MEYYGCRSKELFVIIFYAFVCQIKGQRLSVAYQPTPATWDISLISQRLSCGFRGPESTKIDWYKDGKRISNTDNDRVRVEEPSSSTGMIHSSLIFKKLVKMDEGDYRCKAHNSKGTSYSRSAKLTIVGPPGVNMDTPSPKVISVAWHEPFSLPCVGKGPPNINKVVWHYKGFNDPNRPSLFGTQNKPLNAPSLTTLPREDDAMAKNILFYDVFCTVYNNKGNVRSTTTRINIKQRPGIPKVNKIVRLMDGRGANIYWQISTNGFDKIKSCSLQLHSKPDFIKAYSLPIQSAMGQNEKFITDCTPMKYYTFMIKCSNSIGSSGWSKEYNFTTSEGYPDRSPENVTAQPITETKLKVSWLPVPKGHVKGILRGYKVKILYNSVLVGRIETVDPATRTFEFSGLQSGKKYCARVLAFTKKDGPLSKFVCVTMPFPKPLDPPVIETVTPGASQVTVTYRDGKNKKGELQNCTILVQSFDKVKQIQIEVELGSYEQDIRPLLPNAAYTVVLECISANDISVTSNTHYFRTLEEKPKFSPKKLMLSETEHTLYATWDAIDASRLNGNFTGYNICISSSSKLKTKCYNSIMSTNHTFVNVEPSHLYTVEVAACTNAGCGPTNYKHFRMTSWSTTLSTLPATSIANKTPLPNRASTSIIMIVCIVLGTLVVLCILVFIIYRKTKARKAASTNNSPSVAYTPGNGQLAVGEYDEVPNLSRSNANTINPYSTPMLADSSMLSPETMAKLEGVKFERERLRIFKVLGEGEFGCVYKGKFETSDSDEASTLNGTIDVAVKTMKMNEFDPNEREEFVKEGLRMKNMEHTNVMKLIGICLPESGTNTNGTNQIRLSGYEAVSPLVVLPYMVNGDLRSYLYLARTTNDTKDLTVNRLLHFVHDIASGMEYLSMQNIIHRDLACRNCMLDDKMRVVVSDFGLSRQIYSSNYYRQRRVAKMPVKWMALESLVDRIYTTMTDVWSFGVTAWEVFSFCQNPYPGVANHEMHELLKAGTRLKQPRGCPNDIWNDTIYPCWDPRPDERPTFIELVDMLSEFLKTFTPDYKSSETSEASYVNVIPPEPYEKLSSPTESLLGKDRSRTISSSNNEVPIPYETALERSSHKNGQSQSRDRSSSKRPLLGASHDDGDEGSSYKYSPRVSYL